MRNPLAKNSLSLVWVAKSIALSLYSVRIQRPRSAIRPQIEISLQFLAKREDSEAKIPKMLTKTNRFNLFCFGRGGKALCKFLSYFFVLECVAWFGCLIFFVISLPVSVVFKMYPWYFHFVLLWFVIPVHFYFSAVVGVFLVASFFRSFCRRPSVFLVFRWR